MADVIEIIEAPTIPVVVVANPNPVELTVATGQRGPQGIPGPANELSIGTVVTGGEGSSAAADITGDYPNQQLHLTIPRGNKGDNGEEISLTIGTVTTVPADTPADADIAGTHPNYHLDLSIPRGAGGDFAGGTTGQILAKASNADFDSEWIDATSATAANTLVRRDALGTFTANRVYATSTPVASNELTRKDYVDALGTDASTINSIVRRDSAGRSAFDSITITNTTAPAHAARKDYVDAINTSLDGRIVALESSSLNAVSAPTFNAVIKRDSAGRAQVVDPSAAQDIATKNYVDGLGASAPTVSTIVRRDAAGRFQAVAPSAAADVAVKSYVDALGTDAATVSTIVRRDSAGRFKAVDPSAVSDVATKNYVDSRDIAIGASAATAGALIRRDVNARAQVATPSVAADIATKGYIDGLILPFRSYRGEAATYPSSPVNGDYFYHTTLASQMMYVNGTWRQVAPGFVATKTALDAISTSLLYPGVRLTQNDVYRSWEWTGTKWHFVGGVTPAVMVRRTTTYNMVVNTWTAHPWEAVVSSETSDSAMWTLATPSRMIAPIAGLYDVSGSLSFGATAGTRYIAIRKNGGAASTYIRSNVTFSGSAENPFTTTVKLNANEYVDIIYLTDSAVTVAAFGEIQPHAEMRWAGNF